MATGIVCEFNPLHNGHEYLLQRAKKLKNDQKNPVVCVLSSDFVQRGEKALLTLQKRADLAIKAGADVVLELPFPFCSMSAEIYAQSAVYIMAQSNLCDSIMFGSENNDIQALEKIADILDNSALCEIKKIQKSDSTKSFALARSEYIEKTLGKKYSEISKQPNNILAIEYLRAIKKYCFDLNAYTVQRLGVNHDSKETKICHNKEFASASFIRDCIKSGQVNKIENFVPLYVFEELCKTQVNTQDFEKFIFASLHLKTNKELGEIAEICGGFEHLIKKELVNCRNYAQLFEALKSKSITDAKIRRILLFCTLGIKKEYMKKMPSYTRILAVSDLGKKLIRQKGKDAKIILASRVSHIKKDKEAYRDFCLANNAQKIAEIFS